MSLAHYISLEREIPGLDAFVNGKAIAHANEELENIAIELKLTPIMKFYGGAWRQPAKGLATIRGLIAYLKENPDSVPKSAFVIEDLLDWERVLVAAEASKVRWHMMIDY